MIKTAAEQAAAEPQPGATPTVGTLPSARQGEPGVAPTLIADRYEVERELGQGGMGKVYLAHDRKLARKVAIKLLSGAHTPDALGRFEAEARAAGALNHPNILSVYDIGSGSEPYIVSELLEGHTLRTRMGGKALPLRKTLELSVQLAQGLSAAHEKGVVHRDLKPENLFVTDDGRLKILDFGIAKLAGDRGENRPITQTGTIMGTVGYMSPEQVRGDHADHRADLFSFGAILYELISGKMAFSGHSTMETGSAILHDDPKPLPAGTSEQLESIVLRCLEKDPRDRFQSARDLAFQLEGLRHTTTGPRPAMAGRSRRKAVFASVGTLGLILAFAAGWTLHKPEAPSQPRLWRINTLDDWPFVGRFAPDGVSVLYSEGRSRKLGLVSTRSDSPRSIPMGLPDAAIKSISPQGEVALLLRPLTWNQLGATGGTLARMPIKGGAPREWLEGVDQADYLPDGSMVVLRHSQHGTTYEVEWPAGRKVHTHKTFLGEMRASPDGKTLAFCDQPLAPDDRGFISVLDQQGNFRRLTNEYGTLQGLAWSPKGDEIWFGAGNVWNAELHAVSLDGKERLLMRVPAQLRMLDTDSRGRALVRVATKESGLRCRGPGAPAEVECAPGTDSYANAITRDGNWLLSDNQGEFEPPNYGVYFGKTDGSPAARLGDGWPEGVSPDGKWALVTMLTGGADRWFLYPTGPGEPRELAFDASLRIGRLDFLPDGKRMVAGGVDKDGARRAWLREEDGRLQPIAGVDGPTLGVTRDGRFLILDPPYDPNHAVLPVKLLPLAGGPARELPIAESDRWDIVGKSVDSFFVAEYPAPGEDVARVNRVALDSGKRTPLLELRPPLSGGRVSMLRVSDDGRAYAYGYIRTAGQLYVVDGLR